INKSFSKHSINIELLGKGGIYANVSYEYNINKNFVIGLGLGFMDYYQSNCINFFINTQGQEEKEFGNCKKLDLAIPIYATYKIEKKRNKNFLISAGVSPLILLKYNNFPSKEKFYYYNDYNIYFASFGYEYMPNRFFYRINIYTMYITSGIVIPWLGLSFGIKI
ncbi:MAG: outer membrane beta-barrel protein, partial [Chlorobi bacterium]|nr:outer membrane beta-barrel protein [Chlorobiota bacterium]